MGHSYAAIKVYSKDLSKHREISLLVDTGSTYTWIDTGILKELDIARTGSRKFRTIEGKVIKRTIGEAIVEYNSERATTIIVFAMRDDKQVLGVHALEGLGFEVNPITEKLEKVEAVLAV